MSQTDPVTFETQETEGGRKSIVHVDKLYQYVPEDGEVLHSWLPNLLTVADAGCQVEISSWNLLSTRFGWIEAGSHWSIWSLLFCCNCRSSRCTLQHGCHDPERICRWVLLTFNFCMNKSSHWSLVMWLVFWFWYIWQNTLIYWIELNGHSSLVMLIFGYNLNSLRLSSAE